MSAELENKEGVEPVPAENPPCSAEAARMITARTDACCAEDGHSKRERIALGVFACLLLVGAIALFSYINAGHGLNVAATTIDDAAGDMTGYGVILFEGTVKPDDAASDSDEEGDGVQGILSGIFGSDEDEDAASVKDDALEDVESMATTDRERSEKDLLADDEESSGEEKTGSSSRSADSSASARAGVTGASSASGKHSVGVKSNVVTLEEAEQEYQEKGASIISIDSSDLGRYASGRIIMQGGRSYGIFSLTEQDIAALPHLNKTTTRVTTTTTEDAAGSLTTNTTTRVRSAFTSVSEMFSAIDPDDISPDVIERIEGILEHFQECGVDTVIALTTDPTPFSAVDGIDVVVSFKQSDRFSMSEMIDGTMYFDAPEVGQVGVLMVAPGNVVSAKVMS